MASVQIALSLAGILLLLLCSALVSGSEIAYFSLSPNDRERLELDEKNSSLKILWLISSPEKLLATILISNNFINIAIILLSEILVGQLLPSSLTLAWATAWQDSMPWLLSYSAASIANTIHFSITVIGVTFLLVLFGEVTPKVYATINSIGLARLMSTPLSVLMQVFSPLSQLLVSWSTRFEARLARRKASVAMTSKEEIGEALEIAVSHEEDAEKDLDILKRIIKFSEVSVPAIMRSRVDMVAVDMHDTYDEVLKVIRSSGYSRYPVYENDADNVVGILYSKDLITHLQEKEDFNWQTLVRSNVLFVPMSKKIDDLLKDFQQERMHMAIIVDEYGGTSGLVTLEDILEEVIGDIKDEFDDEPDVIYRKIDNYNYVFEGKTLLNDVARIVGVDTEAFDDIKGESESIAGLLLEQLGEMPKKGQVEQIGAFSFKTLSLSKRRIEEIQISLPPQNAASV